MEGDKKQSQNKTQQKPQKNGSIDANNPQNVPDEDTENPKTDPEVNDFTRAP